MQKAPNTHHPMLTTRFTERLMTKLLKIIGILVALLALVGLCLTFFTALSGPGGKTALASIFIFQFITGAFLTYGAHLKITGSELAQKMFPSSIAALLLFAAFVYRWFYHSV